MFLNIQNVRVTILSYKKHIFSKVSLHRISFIDVYFTHDYNESVDAFANPEQIRSSTVEAVRIAGTDE